MTLRALAFWKTGVPPHGATPGEDEGDDIDFPRLSLAQELATFLVLAVAVAGSRRHR